MARLSACLIEQLEEKTVDRLEKEEKAGGGGALQTQEVARSASWLLRPLLYGGS